MTKTKLSDYLSEETSEAAFQELEEQNTVGGGNIVGYTAPIGAASMATDSKIERGFWQKKRLKKKGDVKTASPAVHNPKALANQ